MKIALQGNVLKLIEVDNVHFAVIKSWNKMKWNRSLKQLEGIADIELLDKLAKLVRLPAHIEAYRRDLHAVQDADPLFEEGEHLFGTAVVGDLLRQDQGAVVAEGTAEVAAAREHRAGHLAGIVQQGQLL